MIKSIFWLKGFQVTLFLAIFSILTFGISTSTLRSDLFAKPNIDSGTSSLEHRSPFEINFNENNSPHFQVHAELELWGRNHNLTLVADSPLRNLQDGLARVIMNRGLSFQLAMPKAGRAWLYLDMVSYRPLGNYQFSRVHWLDVYANNKLVSVIYQGGGNFLKSPQRIAIDREFAPEGQLKITLRPSPGDGSWAIWDAFISRSKE